MAPDSRFWRHQLGDARTSLQCRLLKASLMVFLMIGLSTGTIQARTEPFGDSVEDRVHPFFDHGQPFPGESERLTSLFPPSLIHNPPAGRWSNRIQFHIPNQPAIDQYIRFYKGQGRPTFEDALVRSRQYVPIMTEILDLYGVPADMISVVFVESCFKRHAHNAGAVGYWQLLATTARTMGLRVDRWVDERKDPIKSTQAAAKYLRSCYDQFESWPLALAAYNAGDAFVTSAVRRSRTSDFWELSKRRVLPGITRAYVPKVLAAIQIMRDLEAHGFEYSRHYPVNHFESIAIRSPLRLEQVARWLEVPVSQLQDLNPSLRLGQLPPDSGVNLNVPSGARDKFILAYEQYLRK